MRNLGDKPQCAGRRHDQTKRVRSQDALPLATLVWPRPSKAPASRMAISTAQRSLYSFKMSRGLNVRSVEELRRGQVRDAPRGRAAPEALSHEPVRALASAHTPMGAAHAGVAVSGACPALVVCVWPHGPPRPPQTASAVRVGVLRGEGASLRELGRKDRDGTGRLKGGEDRERHPLA